MSNHLGTKTMMAGVITGPRTLRMAEIPIPEVGEGQMLVKLTAGSICGSDLPFFRYDLTHPEVSRVSASSHAPLPPMLSLHELVGVVTRSRSARFKEGDRVLALPSLHQRGLGEYFVTNSELAVPLPAGRDDHLVVSQPLGTVVHACSKLPNLLGLSAAVVGQGPVGQLFTALLRKMGVSRLIAVDLIPERLSVSCRMGATDTVCADADGVSAAVEELTQGEGVGLAVEAVGTTETLNLASTLVKRNGTLLAFGVPNAHRYDFGFHDFFYREGRLITSVGPDVQRDFPLAVEMIRSGAIDVTPLITHRYALSRAQEGFDLFTDRSGGVVKVVFTADA